MMGLSGARYRIKGTGVYVEPMKPKADVFTSGSGSAPYEAAGHGRRAMTWRASSVGPNAALSYNQGNLVNRSRDAVRKDAMADSAISAIETNVVGTGIKPQWMTSDSGLNRELGELFLEWTDEADADGRLDWYGQQALGVRATVEAGEVFARLRVRRPTDMDSVPLQVQLLESEFCPVDEFRMPARAGGEVRSGVEFDAIGRRRGYWMYRRHPNDWTAPGGLTDLIPVFVPADQIAHVAQLRRPGQIRGEPWLTRALIKLRDVDKYDDAELMRKQVAALIAGFITRNSDDDPGFAGESDPDASGTATVTWEPGTMQVLDPGEDVRFSEPTEVGGTYEVFMRQQHRKVAVAAGVLYEQLTGDYSQVNDRTFRASVNEFRRRAAMWQHHLVAFQYCRPVMRRWIDVGLLAGSIQPPRGMELRELRRVEWIPQGWSYIHPVQEVDAELKAIRGGLKSRSQSVSERGENAEDIDRQNAADNARADDLGIAYDSDGRRPSSGAKASPAEKEDEPERDRQDA